MLVRIRVRGMYVCVRGSRVGEIRCYTWARERVAELPGEGTGGGGLTSLGEETEVERD